jgi:hypothetical protein
MGIYTPAPKDAIIDSIVRANNSFANAITLSKAIAASNVFVLSQRLHRVSVALRNNFPQPDILFKISEAQTYLVFAAYKEAERERSVVEAWLSLQKVAKALTIPLLYTED